MAPAAAADTALGVQDPSEQDALEAINRPVFNFNAKLDRAVLRPAAKVYDRITPNWARRRIGGFFNWLDEPGTAINSLLQGKGKESLSTLGRFIINGSIGLAGMFDPAGRMGMKRASRDFDSTLAAWGMDSGHYMVLPVMGPTDVRDLLGLVGDVILTPSLFLQPSELAVGVSVLGVVDTRAELLPLESAVIGEPYTFMREAYLQSREAEAGDGEAAEEGDDFDF